MSTQTLRRASLRWGIVKANGMTCCHEGNLCGRVLHWKLLCKQDQCGWTAGRRHGLQGRLKSELCALLYDFTWFDKFSPIIPHFSCLLLVSKLPSTNLWLTLYYHMYLPPERADVNHPTHTLIQLILCQSPGNRTSWKVYGLIAPNRRIRGCECGGCLLHNSPPLRGPHVPTDDSYHSHGRTMAVELSVWG